MTMNKKIPEGYQTVMPYLIVKDAPKFLEFAKTVLGAQEKMKEMRDEKHIRHAEVIIGDSTIMFADSTDEFPPRTAGMFVYVNDADATYKNALDHGATSIMPPADQSYGRSCGITGPCGNTWWLTSVIE